MASGTAQSWRARLAQQDDDGGDDGSGRDECVMWSGQQESRTQNKNSRHITATPLHRHTAMYCTTMLLGYLGIRDADDCTGQAPPRRYHLVQHHGRPDDECGSGVTGDDLSSEIASMTRTARPDRTTSIPLVRLTTSATPNPRPVP